MTVVFRFINFDIIIITFIFRKPNDDLWLRFSHKTVHVYDSKIDTRLWKVKNLVYSIKKEKQLKTISPTIDRKPLNR